MKFCFPVRRNLVVNNHGKTKQMENEATIFENYRQSNGRSNISIMKF